MKTVGLAICAAVVAFSFNPSAIAATLDSIQGCVQVNSGAGFHKVAGAAQVAPGASIMADPGASAQILYSDGCRISVRPGSVAVVAPISPCAQGQAAPGQGSQTQENTVYDLLAAGVVIGGSVGAGVVNVTTTATLPFLQAAEEDSAAEVPNGLFGISG
jgi:hypothetical protein